MDWGDGGRGATGDEEQKRTVFGGGHWKQQAKEATTTQGLRLYKRRRFVFESASPLDYRTEETSRRRKAVRSSVTALLCKAVPILPLYF